VSGGPSQNALFRQGSRQPAKQSSPASADLSIPRRFAKKNRHAPPPGTSPRAVGEE